MTSSQTGTPSPSAQLHMEIGSDLRASRDNSAISKPVVQTDRPLELSTFRLDHLTQSLINNAVERHQLEVDEQRLEEEFEARIFAMNKDERCALVTLMEDQIMATLHRPPSQGAVKTMIDERLSWFIAMEDEFNDLGESDDDTGDELR